APGVSSYATPAAPIIGAPAVPPSGLAAPATGGAPRTIKIQTDTYAAEILTKGGRLASLKLKKFRETAAPNSPPLELITPAEGGEFPLGLLVETPSDRIDDRAVNYQTDSPDQITLHGTEHASINFNA